MVFSKTRNLLSSLKENTSELNSEVHIYFFLIYIKLIPIHSCFFFLSDLYQTDINYISLVIKRMINFNFQGTDIGIIDFLKDFELLIDNEGKLCLKYLFGERTLICYKEKKSKTTILI